MESARTYFSEIERELAARAGGIDTLIVAEIATNLARHRLAVGDVATGALWAERAHRYHEAHPDGHRSLALLAALAHADGLHRRGDDTAALALLQREAERLAAFAPGERYEIYGRYLMAAELAFDLEQAALAARMLALGEEALREQPAPPFLAPRREELMRRIAAR
jgi:hypothetical protein